MRVNNNHADSGSDLLPYVVAAQRLKKEINESPKCKYLTKIQGKKKETRTNTDSIRVLGTRQQVTQGGRATRISVGHNTDEYQSIR